MSTGSDQQKRTTDDFPNDPGNVVRHGDNAQRRQPLGEENCWDSGLCLSRFDGQGGVRQTTRLGE